MSAMAIQQLRLGANGVESGDPLFVEVRLQIPMVGRPYHTVSLHITDGRSSYSIVPM